MAYNYECTFNLGDCIRSLNLEEKGKVQEYVTNEVLRLSEPFVPLDEANLYPNPGRLKDSGHVENEEDVVWQTPYARRWYYEEAHFQGSPTRGTYWVSRMLQGGGLKSIEDGARKVAGS